MKSSFYESNIGHSDTSKDFLGVGKILPIGGVKSPKKARCLVKCCDYVSHSVDADKEKKSQLGSASQRYLLLVHKPNYILQFCAFSVLIKFRFQSQTATYYGHDSLMGGVKSQLLLH